MERKWDKPQKGEQREKVRIHYINRITCSRDKHIQTSLFPTQWQLICAGDISDVRVQLPDACTDEAPGMLRITIFMIARRHVIAFWEQASDQAFACTPGHDDAYWWPS